jgi:salicylate 1-O-methyltransferase
MVSDDKGDFGYAPLLDAMYAALKDLAADGLVSEQEFHGMVIRTVARSNAKFEAPLADGGAVRGLKTHDVEIFPGEDCIWAAFEANATPARSDPGWPASPGPPCSRLWHRRFRARTRRDKLSFTTDTKPGSPRAVPNRR